MAETTYRDADALFPWFTTFWSRCVAAAEPHRYGPRTAACGADCQKRSIASTIAWCCSDLFTHQNKHINFSVSLSVSWRWLHTIAVIVVKLGMHRKVIISIIYDREIQTDDPRCKQLQLTRWTEDPMLQRMNDKTMMTGYDCILWCPLISDSCTRLSTLVQTW